jgi:hypothetical protein
MTTEMPDRAAVMAPIMPAGPAPITQRSGFKTLLFKSTPIINHYIVTSEQAGGKQANQGKSVLDKDKQAGYTARSKNMRRECVKQCKISEQADCIQVYRTFWKV